MSYVHKDKCLYPAYPCACDKIERKEKIEAAAEEYADKWPDDKYLSKQDFKSGAAYGIELCESENQKLRALIDEMSKALVKFKNNSCCNICECSACLAKEILELKDKVMKEIDDEKGDV